MKRLVVFVSDAFVQHYVGGAELTTEALITSCLLPNGRILSKDVTPEIMQSHCDCFWVFGNFNSLSEACMLYAIKNLNYSILEYDYKFCKYRSPEKHALLEGSCNCAETTSGKLRAMFIARSKISWWMSEAQKSVYKAKFPFIGGEVLNSVFSEETLDYIDSLDTTNKNDKWVILKSGSWIKGVQASIKYAEENELDYELVWGLEYKDFLAKLATSRGLIFLPTGGDTCPRMVIEAKLLGCELVLNDNVQHKNEPWFATRDSCWEHLRSRINVFWEEVEEQIEFLPDKGDQSDTKYYIISPFYNAERYLTRCIDSIKMQTHKNFKCILIDDMSTDKSYDVAANAIAEDNRFMLIKNDTKSYALQNIYRAIELSDAAAEDVVILLDGDDWFASRSVLRHLGQHYEDSDCWVTYGSYVMHPHGLRGPEPSEYPLGVIERNSYRQDLWRASHLRTFRQHMWDKIDKKDLKDADGNFYEMTYDQAIMLPLLEMAGPRCKYIPEILHVYNKENPLNVDKTRTQEQVKTAQEIRSKSPYERL